MTTNPTHTIQRHADQITLTWHIEDVQEVRPDLTSDQARAVLRRVRDSHDACIGVNWDVLTTVAGDLFPVP